MSTESDFEIIVVAYNDVNQAGEIFNQLEKMQKNNSIKVLTAAVLVKDMEGKTLTEATMKVAQKKGTRYGALVGGLLAIVAPPVGMASVLVGAVGGGIVGREIKKKPQRDFTTEFLNKILAEMKGDSSALVLLAEAGAADLTAATLAEFGGEMYRSTLSNEAVDQLAQTTAKAKQKEKSKSSKEQLTLSEEFKEMVKEGTRREGPEIKRVIAIINPASGQDATILNTLNSVFRAADIDWDIAITKKYGDAARLAQEAAQAGEVDIVAVYGGDGTVMETAGGLIGTTMPLAILPGGTNNVLSVELGIPKDLVQAAGLIASSSAQLRMVDMGKANDQYFILRVGIGYEAQINELANREMKDRFGGMAYTLAGLQALKDPPIAQYRLTLDGEVEELEGVWCMVANSASLGIPNVGIVEGVDVSDGLLDVIVVSNRDLDSLLAVAGSIAKNDRVGKPLPHWQVREVLIEADPPMAVTGDGEIWDPTPLKVSVIPNAVQILVPA